MLNLKAANGEVILSSETYRQKRPAEEGIASVKANASDDSRLERKTAKDGSPYFVLKAANGEILGKSEMYSSVAAMDKGIASVVENATEAEIVDTAAGYFIYRVHSVVLVCRLSWRTKNARLTKHERRE
jgi:uncharacterized protein YegP (UPF0339 family)